MKSLYKSLIISMFGFGLLGTASAWATETVTLVIKDHTFQPSEITIPAKTKVKLVIQNQDASPEEFESKSMHREKMIPAGAERTISIGPLEPGNYDFFGEFNPKTAKGRVVVK